MPVRPPELIAAANAKIPGAGSCVRRYFHVRTCYQEYVAAHVLTAVEDLFFLVQIQDAAKRAGCTIDIVRSPEAFSNSGAQLAIIDLNASALAPLELMKAAKAAGVDVLAFVPHVQVDLRQQAIDTGAGKVVARSNFAQHLHAALKELSPTR